MYKLPPNIVKTFASTFKKEKPKTSSTVYGYAVINEGKIYVKLDGSTEYTPVVSTIDVVDGDRVIVNITNHRAIIVNNISSPAARSNSVAELKGELSDMTDVHKTAFAFKSLNNVTLESFYDYMIKKGFITRYVKMSDETEEASAVVSFNLSSGAAISGSNILNNSITSDKLADSVVNEIVQGVLEALPEIVQGVLEALPDGTDVEYWWESFVTIGILTITSVYDQDGTKSTEPLNRVYINTSYTVWRG